MTRALLSALVLAVLSPAALAAVPMQPPRVSATPMVATGAAMIVPINKSQTLRVDRPIARALVGNAEIADVLPTSVSSVYVMGKKIGVTNLTLIDHHGDAIAIVDVVVGPDALGLKQKLADLLPDERVGVTVSNDSIVLEGEVSSPAAAERAATVAETYAPKKVVNLMRVGQPQQVLLEVRFAEMSRGTVKQLGLSNFNFFNSTPIPSTSPSMPSQTLQPPSSAYPVNPLVGTFGSVSVPNISATSNPYSATIGILGAGISFTLQALEQKGLIHTLAEPNLVALSGETASFLAGGEFPVPVGVDNLGRISIEFKQFGVALAFVPTVIEDGLINLSVAPEVSQLDPSVGVQISGFQIPGLKVRRAKTQLELRDGQAFAMAGLIQSDFQDTVKAIPLLGRIPILGTLFRSTLYQRNETELVIVVTPHIVRPVRPSDVRYPTDRVRQPSDIDLFLNGHSEHRVPAKPAYDVRPGGLDADYGHVLR